jgi:hypothetical protein
VMGSWVTPCSGRLNPPENNRVTYCIIGIVGTRGGRNVWGRRKFCWPFQESNRGPLVVQSVVQTAVMYRLTSLYFRIISRIQLPSVISRCSRQIPAAGCCQIRQQVLYVVSLYIYIYIYIRTNSDLCHLQPKLIGFYNRDEKCLQRGTDWGFK